MKNSGKIMTTVSIENVKTKIKNPKVFYYVLLLILVLGSAVMVVFQVFEYRHDYRELSKYYRERDDLNAEWGRLLIEQQTFGATAQIGTRAVTQLRMYSPPAKQTVVISLPMKTEDKK
ncbi:cell division protein FtsL [Acinetobacter equi]